MTQGIRTKAWGSEWGGQVPIQEGTASASGQRHHILDESCWCEPIVEYVPPRIKHRQNESRSNRAVPS